MIPWRGVSKEKQDKGSLRSLLFECVYSLKPNCTGFTRSPLQTKSLDVVEALVLLFYCRGGGIRTPGPREGSPVFKTGAINRSTTPLARFISLKDAKLRLCFELQKSTLVVILYL